MHGTWNVEIVTPYIAESRSEIDVELLDTKLDTWTEGLDDTKLSLRFRLSDKRKNDVNCLFSLISVFPSGHRKDGTLGEESGGATVSEPKRDYPGEGVISYGAGFAVSGTSGSFEHYLAASYIFGGRRTRHEIKEHYADEAMLQLGVQIRTAPHAAIDFNLTGFYNSPETWEDDRDRTRRASFIVGTANIGMYLEFAPDATFMIGARYTMIETHEIDRDSGVKLKEAIAITPTIGFHILF